MRTWPILIFGGVFACQPAGPGNLDDSTTSSESSTTSSESSDTSSESSDTSTDTTGDDEPACAGAAPGGEILRCLDAYSGGLALDADWLYFTHSTNNGDVLQRMRDDGSDYEVLADTIGDARVLTVVDGLIYWNDFYGGRVRRMPVDGGPIEDVVVDLIKPNSYAIHEGLLYVTQYETAQDLLRVSIDGGGPEVLYAGLEFAGALHHHDLDLWWVTNTNNGNVNNNIVRGTLSGDPVEVFLDDGGGVTSDATHLYWITAGPAQTAVHRMLHAGGATEDVLTVAHRAAFILAGDYLYWRIVSIDNTGHDGEIHRAPKDGGPAELLVDGQNYPSEVVVGDAYVYWTTQQAIARLALP